MQALKWQLALPRKPRGAARSCTYPFLRLVRQRACVHCGRKGDFRMTCFPGAVRYPDGRAVQQLGLLCLRCGLLAVTSRGVAVCKSVLASVHFVVDSTPWYPYVQLGQCLSVCP
jgi:hypothetical protein